MFCGVTLLLTVGAWIDFTFAHGGIGVARDGWDRALPGLDLMVDSLNAPLLPVGALLYLLTIAATMRTKIRRFSFPWTMVSLSILLATFSCRQPWLLVVLTAVSAIPIYWELRTRGRPTRVFLAHMAFFVGLLVIGQLLVQAEGAGRMHSAWAIIPIMLAVAGRCGTVPFHCWITDLFEQATFGTALLFVSPMAGAYVAARLAVPVAPNWVLQAMGWMALSTAVYAACMALVQTEARRFFSNVFISQSALVFVGLVMSTPISVTGALCVWISVSLSLAGWGLTLRSMEARIGNLSLAEFRGLYEHTPTLASFFLLTGLASVGFPGTFGFVGTELLVDGAVRTNGTIGMAVVFAAAINGIAVLHAYLRLFTGTRHRASISLGHRPAELFAVLTLALLILGVGVFPSPMVNSRYNAAIQLLDERAAVVAGDRITHADDSRMPLSVARRVPLAE
jgi:NADH-quinone oxidoreductase subunit M